MSVPRPRIFGEEAGAYDRARPGYPQSLIEEVLSRTRVETALEIGAGTGKATLGFARPGIRIVCLEPSEAMAEVLASRGLPGVEVVPLTFEEYQGRGGGFDLVYAAQAWHWVDQDRGYVEARRLLRPGGLLALLWNVPRSRYLGFEEVYREHAPEILADEDERIRRRDSDVWEEELRRAGFAAVELMEQAWTQHLDAVGLRTLYASYSDHIMLPEPRRRALLDALERSARDQGGEVAIDYVTKLFLGIEPGR